MKALCTGPIYPPGNIPGTNFCYRLSQPQGDTAARCKLRVPELKRKVFLCGVFLANGGISAIENTPQAKAFFFLLRILLLLLLLLNECEINLLVELTDDHRRLNVRLQWCQNC
jgi:hypothetical protein